jgi:hypothetical protein
MVVAGVSVVGVVLDVDVGRGENHGGEVVCEACLCCAYMSLDYEVRLVVYAVWLQTYLFWRSLIAFRDR